MSGDFARVVTALQTGMSRRELALFARDFATVLAAVCAAAREQDAEVPAEVAVGVGALAVWAVDLLLDPLVDA